MDTNWYKNVNPQLNKLAALLDMGEKPSHGYTIAEKAPEVVTAPGVYFPAEKGEVIPIEPKADGGAVTPSLHKDNDRARLEMLNSIISMVKPSRLESRQFGGSVIPPQGELERLGIEQSKYDILKNAISALKPTGKDRPSYNERTSKHGSPSGPSTFSTKSTEPDLYDKLKNASGSFDMAPSMPKPPELGSYPMKPDATKDDDLLLSSVPMESRQAGGTVVPPEDLEFMNWYKNAAKKSGLNPDPYDPRHSYDYRAAYDAGVRNPDETGHWPSQFKLAGHPNLIVGGVNTKTGDLVTTYSPETPESLELESRKKWAAPGYAEQALAEAQKVSPNAIAISPGYERGYYEAHPEERILEGIEEANKPAMESAQKLIEEARTRAGGFGLMGMSPKEAALARIQATKNIPDLEKSLAGIGASTVAAKEGVVRDLSRGEKAPAPHLVQDESGQYVWATPGGILPAGISGRAPQPRSLTNEELVRGDLKARLQREPTAGEVLNEIDNRKLNMQMGGIKPLPAGTVAAPRGMKNDAALEGLTEEQKGVVRGMSEYKYPWPGSFAMRDPKWQALMGRIEMYDPSFDAKEYQVRFRVRQDFTSGKAAQNIRSLNTAVAHLDTLSKKATALDNAPVQVWNAIKNKGLTAVGDKRVTEFNNAATAVESELANVFKGMGATDQEIKAWRQNLSASQSPEQLRGAINTAIDLMSGRLGALQAQYETGMGMPKDFRFLSPKSLSILKGLGMNVDAVDPMSASSTESGGTTKRLPNESIADYLKRIGGM